ncbi:MAG: RNA methyltransferase [Patescibacteria group bacterium]
MKGNKKTKRKKKRVVVILEDIRSAHNVGSIFRTADAAGFEKVYLCGITPEPIDRLGRTPPALLKASLGAERFVSWEKVSRATVCIKKLKKEGWRIYALEQHKGAMDYKKKISGQKIALVLGNEVLGVSPEALREADRICEIPMSGKKESLNVSVAFGIMAFRLRDSL